MSKGIIYKPKKLGDDYVVTGITGALTVRDSNGKSVSSFSAGQRIKIILPKETKIDNGKTWIKVYYDGNKIGWVSKEFVKEYDERDSRKITALDSTGHNMIANMERNLSLIEYDKRTGLITSIPKTSTDVGYGHDFIVNPLPSVSASLSAGDAYKLLIDDAKAFENAIANGINADFTQNQFNALVSLRYNVGSLGVIDGLLPYLERGVYKRSELKDIINSHYDGIIKNNPTNEKYRDGWYNRTEKMLDIFFDGNYGYMPIDAVNGKVIIK